MSNIVKKLRHTIAKTLVSVFVITIFFIPMALAIRWGGGLFDDAETRKVADVPALQVRAVDQNPAPVQPFRQPLISVTFDDGWQSVYTEALPILQKHGIKTTQYIISGTLEDPLYMSVDQLRSMQAAGHEMGSHTITHADLTTLSDDQLHQELKLSKDTLTPHLGQIRDFTSPLGAYNAHTLDVISKYYRSQKNAEGDPRNNLLGTLNTADDFTPINIRSYSIRGTTTMQDLRSLLEATRKQNAWLVLTYHQVDNSGALYSVTPEVFDQHMKLLAETDIRTATIGQVLDILELEKEGEN